jgi:hypothetical protein
MKIVLQLSFQANHNCVYLAVAIEWNAIEQAATVAPNSTMAHGATVALCIFFEPCVMSSPIKE